MSPARKLISVVTPCYNEQETVRDCHQAVKNLFASELREYDYEHIFCDNASPDQTVPILKELAAEDHNVKVIINSRNFGGLRSLFNGVKNANGDAVVVMLPADLQDPPHIIPEFVRKWEEGFEVVYGVRKNREEGRILAGVRGIYYHLLNRLAYVHIPPNAGEFQLVDRRVIVALREFEDSYPYIRGMIASCGFRATGIEYTWVARKKGVSKHRIYHLVDTALNGMVSFSNVPLRVCMFFGLTIAAASMVYAIIAFAISLIYYQQLAQPGIPTLIVSLFFFSGVQLFFAGIIGEYLGAIHAQVRKRPMVIERERINFEHQKGAEGSRELLTPPLRKAG